MFVAYKNDILFPSYVDDTLGDTPAESYKWLTGKELPEDKFFDDALLEEYGTETKWGETYQLYEIRQVEPINVYCKDCHAQITQTRQLTEFDIYNHRHRYMGSVYCYTLNDAFEKADLIKNGHCPICESWHTGSINDVYCERVGFGFQRYSFDNDTMERVDDYYTYLDKK